MNKHINFLSTAVITSLLLSGCSTRLGQFTAASSQNVRNLNYSIGNKTKAEVEGDTCIHTILLLPVGYTSDRLQRAMDDAIKNGHDKGVDGDLLVNVRIDHSNWSAVIYGQDCVSVSGDLVKLDG